MGVSALQVSVPKDADRVGVDLVEQFADVLHLLGIPAFPGFRVARHIS